MSVTHIPRGFTGTVDQVAEARRFSLATAPFRVASSSDWRPTVVTTTDRTVQIAAGAAEACGVYDSTTATDTVQFAANSTGTVRYDALVAVFDWGTLNVSFAAIQGTTTPPAINQTSISSTSQIDRIPGTRYEALLGIVAINPGQGALTAASLSDCRVWGTGATLIAAGNAYKELIDVPVGGLLRLPAIPGVRPSCEITYRDGMWRLVSPSPLVSFYGDFTNAPGTYIADPSPITAWTVPDLGFGVKLAPNSRVETGADSGGGRWDTRVFATQGGTDTEIGRTEGIDSAISYQEIHDPPNDRVFNGAINCRVDAFKGYTHNVLGRVNGGGGRVAGVVVYAG